jgi:hypothetical protein
MSLKSWWDSLWEGNQNVDEDGLPRITETIPMPEVKPCKPEKDISEPVLSFIELYKKNHRRFKISADPFGTAYVDLWTLYDRLNGKTFTALVGWGYCNNYYKGSKNAEWITEDELVYIFDEIRSFSDSRKTRIHNKKNIRVRERLTKLYKGE